MRRRRIALSSGLALAYSLARLGDQMLYVVLPSHPAAAGIATARLGIVLLNAGPGSLHRWAMKCSIRCGVTTEKETRP